MSNFKIIAEPWNGFCNEDTIALSLNTESQYTVSEFITLLEEAKKKWGDKQILIHDFNSNIIGGFTHVYLHHGFDYREEYGDENCYQDDTICIFC